MSRSEVRVRAVQPGDAEGWLRMRLGLWPDGGEQHRTEIQAFLAGTAIEPKAVLVAEDGRGGYLGFVELSLRAYAEGCDTSPVAYLEGWFVEPEARRSGVGRALLTAAEDWGRSQACLELASDAEEDNALSAQAHGKFGFTEVGLIRCFRKDL